MHYLMLSNSLNQIHPFPHLHGKQRLIMLAKMTAIYCEINNKRQITKKKKKMGQIEIKKKVKVNQMAASRLMSYGSHVPWSARSLQSEGTCPNEAQTL